VFGTFLLSQAALKVLPPGGAIINTTSIQAYEPSQQLVAYAASKAAILSMTKSIADLAIKQGVRVNAVAPGPVWTPPNTFHNACGKSRDFWTEYGVR
jgi:NAD(P)-dependent dehydrogenase (short-subunit alcohol dehydrogenase family)